jgi:nuclear GTP-binding protein
LVPREVGEAWLKHYRQELPAVAFKASTQQQADGLGKAKAVKGSKGKKGAAAAAGGSEASYAAAGSACLGADTLLQLLKNYARNAMGGKGSITVGVVGLPNVGKSSLINSLKRARVAQVRLVVLGGVAVAAAMLYSYSVAVMNTDWGSCV